MFLRLGSLLLSSGWKNAGLDLLARVFDARIDHVVAAAAGEQLGLQRGVAVVEVVLDLMPLAFSKAGMVSSAM